MWERGPQEEWTEDVKETRKDGNERKQNALHMCEIVKGQVESAKKRPELDITCLIDMAKVTNIFIIVIIKFKLNLFCVLSL